MPMFRVGDVSELTEARPGLQRVRVTVDGQSEPAYVLTDLIGPVEVGDRVVVNTTAVELELGTGGWHVVHWNLTREPDPGGFVADESARTRLAVKLRYTSLQTAVDAAGENGESSAPDLAGLPVVVAGLHSQVAAIAVAFKQALPAGRLVYVMTDGGALPIAISDLVWDLRERSLIDTTVTCGHAFGGDIEAVSLYDALLGARPAADAVVVAMGPGGAGTASRLGFSAMEVGGALDAVTGLHGRPIAALRSSFADPRSRHQGISHHSLTALTVGTRSRVRVPVPCVGGDEEQQLRTDLTAAGIHTRHEIVDVAPVGVVALFEAHDLRVASMGRLAGDDPVLFESAAVAGALAAQTVPS
jgi:Protein of unknown function (DUF3866)